MDLTVFLQLASLLFIVTAGPLAIILISLNKEGSLL